MNCIRRLSRVISVVACACVMQPVWPQKQKPQFKVQVNVVSLDVEVLDSKGTPIDNLGQNDFVVRENGSTVVISTFSRVPDLSLSLVISLGTSYLTQTNLGIAKDAIFQLIHLLKPEDEICLYTFDQRDAYLEQRFTRDRSKVINALDNIGVTSRSRRPPRLVRGFNIPPQAGLGIDLGMAEAKKGAHRKKALLLVRDRVEELGLGSLEHVQESGCTLIALGFSTKAANRLMLITDQSSSKQLILGTEEGMASEVGGSVTELCRTIVHLLKSRYSLTYQTPLAEGRGTRQIEVLVPGCDCRILAKRSYTSAR